VLGPQLWTSTGNPGAEVQAALMGWYAEVPLQGA